MSPLWEQLLDEAPEERVLPWLGGRDLVDGERAGRIAGALPVEHAWIRFRLSGREAHVLGPDDPDPDFGEGRPLVRGFLVGHRLLPDDARVDSDPARFVEQTRPVHLVEGGLERFARVACASLEGGRLVYLHLELPLGPEDEVLAAWLDRRPTVDHVPGVPPALDLAFRFLTRERRRAEERRRRAEEERERERRRREEEERLREELRSSGSGASRRSLARRDFAAAARQALALSGARLLDTREGYRPEERVVRYRFRERRWECVVERDTLRVVDAGICLTDEHTGERGDDRFTLESLPGVVAESLDRDRLVVYRHL